MSCTSVHIYFYMATKIWCFNINKPRLLHIALVIFLMNHKTYIIEKLEKSVALLPVSFLDVFRSIQCRYLSWILKCIIARDLNMYSFCNILPFITGVHIKLNTIVMGCHANWLTDWLSLTNRVIDDFRS